MQTRSDYWLITYTATIQAKVQFDENLTEQEAIAAYLMEEYVDVTDEWEQSVQEVTEAVPL